MVAGYNPKYAATHTTRWLKMANIKQRLDELNKAAEAALAAGYSPRTARFSASRLLTKVNISEKLFELNEFADDEAVANVVERKKILTEIVRGTH